MTWDTYYNVVNYSICLASMVFAQVKIYTNHAFNSPKWHTIACPHDPVGAPFVWHGITLFSAWISNYLHYEVWDEITRPITNSRGCTLEVWQWKNNFIPYSIGHVITLPCWVKVPHSYLWVFQTGSYPLCSPIIQTDDLPLSQAKWSIILPIHIFS